MTAQSRHIAFCLLIALLALSVVAFPAAASGVVAHCKAGHAERQVSAGSHACCAAEDAPSPEDRDTNAPESSGCANCPHACCRPAVDVVHVWLDLLLDRVVIAAPVLPVESVHDADACDAIFHPPRA